MGSTSRPPWPLPLCVRPFSPLPIRIWIRIRIRKQQREATVTRAEGDEICIFFNSLVFFLLSFHLDRQSCPSARAKQPTGKEANRPCIYLPRYIYELAPGNGRLQKNRLLSPPRAVPIIQKRRVRGVRPPEPSSRWVEGGIEGTPPCIDPICRQGRLVVAPAAVARRASIADDTADGATQSYCCSRAPEISSCAMRLYDHAPTQPNPTLIKTKHRPAQPG